MKIYYVTPAKLPTEKAHGYQVAVMCQEWAKLGYKVELVISNRWSHIKDDIFDYYGLEKIFNVKKIGWFDFLKLEKYIGRLGWLVFRVSFLLNLWGQNFEKEAIFYTREAEVAWLLSLKYRKVFYEGHNWPKRHILHKWFLKNISKIVVITSGLKRIYVKSGFREENILVAPDGVDLDKFGVNITKKEAKERLRLPQDKKIVMYIGLFDKWKGYRTLLEASELFDKDTVLVMIGGNKDQIDNLKKEYDKVLFLGFLPYSDLPLNQTAADILVMPNSGKENISKYYTSPLKMFSYMASGVPIVASDLPSIREVLSEKEAVLVGSDNSEVLWLGIREALENKEMSCKRINRCLDKVRNYSWKNRATNIINFLIKT